MFSLNPYTKDNYKDSDFKILPFNEGKSKNRNKYESETK